MGRGVARLIAISDACGKPVDEVVICAGISVKIEFPQTDTWFADRLREIDQAAQLIAQTWNAAWHGVSENDVRGKLLLHDGWAISLDRMKTPPWMEPHTELTLTKAATFPGCRWLLQMPGWMEWHEWKTDQDRRKSQNAEGRWPSSRSDDVDGLHQADARFGSAGFYEAATG